MPATLRPEAPVSVWAPHAAEVAVVIDHQRHLMSEQPGGWFSSQQEILPGQRYGFSLRRAGEQEWTPPLPDPRSMRQPDGVHGLSTPVAPFAFSDDAWRGRRLAQEIIYELHVGTFSPEGTFAGVESRLEYLQDLGVTAIELMPVQPFGGTRNWGYDGVDWFAVHEAYGGPEGLAKLVDACHDRGMAVILDVVFNHFGPDGNYLPMFGPYLTSAQTGWGEAINYSHAHSDEVRRYCLDAARMWLETYHIDGLRLDAVHAYDDLGAYSIMEQLQHVAEEVTRRTGCEKYLIAESDLNDPKLISPTGYNLAAQWVDDLHHCIHTLVSGEHGAYYADYANAGIEGLAKAYEQMFFFQGDYSTFRARTHGRPIDALIRPQRGIIYTTTHDQTGNRAQGDRPSQNLCAAQLELKAALVLLSPYVPMLFMGEEFAASTPFAFFCSHESDELNEATRLGRIKEFAQHGWKQEAVLDPSDPATFEASKLNWEFSPEQQQMLDCYRRLIALRTKHRLWELDFSEMNVRHDGPVLKVRYPSMTLRANCSSAPSGGLEGWGYEVIEG